MDLDFIINTERLTLRPFLAEDAPLLNHIANQEYVLKWMPDWQADIKKTENLIQWFIAQYPLATRSTARVMLAVELEGKLIGLVGLGNKEEVDDEIEIAYFISSLYAGKGYITEAAKALADWAFSNLKMDYLIAIVETDNFPSQRVVEKCGFQKIDSRMILNSGESEEKPFFYYRLYNAEHDPDSSI